MHAHGCIDAGLFSGRGVVGILARPGGEQVRRTDSQALPRRDAAARFATYDGIALCRIAGPWR